MCNLALNCTFQQKVKSLEMQAFAHRKEAEAVSYCTDTSRWSSPSRSDGSEVPQFKFECEDKVDAIPSLKWHPGRKLGIFLGRFNIFVVQVVLLIYFICNSLYHQ